MRHSLKFSKKIGYFPHSEVPSQSFGKEIGHKHSENLDLKLSPNTLESLGYVDSSRSELHAGRNFYHPTNDLLSPEKLTNTL